MSCDEKRAKKRENIYDIDFLFQRNHLHISTVTKRNEVNIDVLFVVDDDTPWILIQQEDRKIWFDFEEAPHLAQCFEA